MEDQRILIVDDNANIRKILNRTLSRKGWNSDTAVDGEDAIVKLAQNGYDLVLLDLYMEPVDGLQVLEEIRNIDPEIVVIILTAHGSMESAVKALRLGAYDYLFKPATPETIQLRVSEGLRRREQILNRRRVLSQIESLKNTLVALDADGELQLSPETDTRFLRSSDLIIDRSHRTASMGDKLLDLTTAEFDILVCLVGASPQAQSPQQLVRQALGYEIEDSEARSIVKWHIHQLRSKIEPNQKKPRYILTVRYKGYLWAGN